MRVIIGCFTRAYPGHTPAEGQCQPKHARASFAFPVLSAQLLAPAAFRATGRNLLVVDATGVGAPVVDVLRLLPLAAQLEPVMIRGVMR